MPQPDILLIVGGDDTHPEIWSPEFNTCQIETFEAKSSFTLDTVGNTVVSCLEEKCDKLEDSYWTILTSTLVSRKDHTSAVFDSKILLIGGTAEPSSTEWIPLDGSEAYSGFTISPRKKHCSIQPSPNIVILTGGSGSGDRVTEMTLPNGTPERDLPSLNVAREYHACGSYEYQGKQVA